MVALLHADETMALVAAVLLGTLLVLVSRILFFPPRPLGQRPPGPRQTVDTHRLPHSEAARTYMVMAEEYGERS